jgi:hypothetical protein
LSNYLYRTDAEGSMRQHAAEIVKAAENNGVQVPAPPGNVRLRGRRDPGRRDEKHFGCALAHANRTGLSIATWKKYVHEP